MLSISRPTRGSRWRAVNSNGGAALQMGGPGPKSTWRCPSGRSFGFPGSRLRGSRMPVWRCLLLTCWAALGLGLVTGGCSPEPPAAVHGVPARIVSLAPSSTEIVYGLGEGDRLVGVCGQCDYPEAAAQIPRVGGSLAPSVEAVLGVRPDLVLVVPSPGNR